MQQVTRRGAWLRKTTTDCSCLGFKNNKRLGGSGCMGGGGAHERRQWCRAAAPRGALWQPQAAPVAGPATSAQQTPAHGWAPRERARGGAKCKRASPHAVPRRINQSNGAVLRKNHLTALTAQPEDESSFKTLL